MYHHDSLEEVVVHRLALIVFKIGKRRCLNSDIEAPTLVHTKRYPDKRHLPTVQISRYGYRSRGQFLVLNIKTCRERDTRLWCQIDTTIKTERLEYILRNSIIRIT